MSATVQEIYNAALNIMNESGSESYRSRTPAIVNTLIGRCWMASEEHQRGGHSMWTPVNAMSDVVDNIDDTLARSAMPYGLAAMLYLDEDPLRSRSWWDVFQETVELCRRNRPADPEPIDNVYGGFGYDGFGRW